MPDSPLPSTVEAITAASVARIAAADADAHKAQCAFAAGQFEAYMAARHAELQEAIQDEWERLFRPPADSGDGQAGG